MNTPENAKECVVEPWNYKVHRSHSSNAIKIKFKDGLHTKEVITRDVKDTMKRIMKKQTYCELAKQHQLSLRTLYMNFRLSRDQCIIILKYLQSIGLLEITEASRGKIIITLLTPKTNDTLIAAFKTLGLKYPSNWITAVVNEKFRRRGKKRILPEFVQEYLRKEKNNHSRPFKKRKIESSNNNSNCIEYEWSNNNIIQSRKVKINVENNNGNVHVELLFSMGDCE